MDKIKELEAEIERLRAQIEQVQPTQPHPTGGHGDVWLEMIHYTGEDHPLHKEMKDRRALGLARYGQPLQYGDGRDNDLDLKEELLDAAAYSWRGGLKSLAIYLLDVANAVGKRRRHHPKCEWDDCQGGCWDLFYES